MFLCGHYISILLSCQEFLYHSLSFFKIRLISAVNAGEIKAFVYSFRKEAILKDLDWALDFWLNKRKAIPTRNQAKCRACEYSGMCNSSLMK